VATSEKWPIGVIFAFSCRDKFLLKSGLIWPVYAWLSVKTSLKKNKKIFLGAFLKQF
jgi:hypothetical protein